MRWQGQYGDGAPLRSYWRGALTLSLAACGGDGAAPTEGASGCAEHLAEFTRVAESLGGDVVADRPEEREGAAAITIGVDAAIAEAFAEAVENDPDYKGPNGTVAAFYRREVVPALDAMIEGNCTDEIDEATRSVREQYSQSQQVELEPPSFLLGL
jgi:hypothetical protein